MSTFAKQAALVILAAGVLVGSSSCIMEDRVIEVVLNDETCADFSEDQTSISFVTPRVIDYAAEIARILEENDISRDEIVEAHLMSVTYGISSFSHTHDWTIEGQMTVAREDISDGPAALFNYTSLSIQDTYDLGTDLKAPLNPDGVGIINRAFEDFIAGENPILVFRVNNSGVTPTPGALDHLQFAWHSCIKVQVVTTMDAEVPDPF